MGNQIVSANESWPQTSRALSTIPQRLWIAKLLGYANKTSGRDLDRERDQKWRIKKPKQPSAGLCPHDAAYTIANKPNNRRWASTELVKFGK